MSETSERTGQMREPRRHDSAGEVRRRPRLPLPARQRLHAAATSTPRRWSRSLGSTGSASIGSGSASTTSSRTATCRPSRPWRARPPRSRSGCGSRRTSPSSRSPTRFAWPRTSPSSISSRAGASSSASASATRRTSSAAFGFPVSHRVSLTEECVDILRLAWSGERFSYHGKRYHFDDVRVTPDPVQPGGPPLWMAVRARPSVERAVRYDTHVLPQGPASLVLDAWRDANLGGRR